jgi:hypothetical protein
MLSGKRKLVAAGAFLSLAGVILAAFLVIGVQYGDTYRGDAYPSFWAASKHIVKRAVHEVKNGIYHEATKYNPPGDTVPDHWDDVFLRGIKSIL